MNLLFIVSVSISAGILIGFILGGMKAMIGKKDYSDRQRERAKALINKFSHVIKYATIILLAIGLVWCIYFLIMGIVIPDKVDYANNMAELIVAVLSVISIIFAFIEFIKREK